MSLERENKLDMFTLDGDTLSMVPLFRKETLARPNNIVSRQAAGTVHVHPNGRFVYAANRADTTTEFEGKKVFVGGENNIATYVINQETGEPTPIDHAETHGIHCRTFHIDPSGRLLVAAHIRPLLVQEGTNVRQVPACLSVFRISNDGKLDFVRKYDVDVGNNYDVLDGDGEAVGSANAARIPYRCAATVSGSTVLASFQVSSFSPADRGLFRTIDVARAPVSCESLMASVECPFAWRCAIAFPQSSRLRSPSSLLRQRHVQCRLHCVSKRDSN